MRHLLSQPMKCPLEWIIPHQPGEDSFHRSLSELAPHTFIRLIPLDEPDNNRAKNMNYAAKRARFPVLLFLEPEADISSIDFVGAMNRLMDETIGVVGIPGTPAVFLSLSDSNSDEPKQAVQVRWEQQPQAFRPISSSAHQLENPNRVVAATGGFLLCRKSDFLHAGGVAPSYSDTPAIQDIEFCMRLEHRLKKSTVFLSGSHIVIPSDLAERYAFPSAGFFSLTTSRNEEDNPIRSLEAPDGKSSPLFRILFVLPGSLYSNNGFQVERLFSFLKSRNIEAVIAATDIEPSRSEAFADGPVSNRLTLFPFQEHLSSITTYEKYLSSPPIFSGSGCPDIIHAWTPRELVRKFVDAVPKNQFTRLLVHLEDNEEYLTASKLGLNPSTFAQHSLAELDDLVPDSAFHPIRGQYLWKDADAITVVSKELLKFNKHDLPHATFPPVPDRRLFFPRPINWELRDKLNIDPASYVWAYPGNLHPGNRKELSDLYKALMLLNDMGCSTVLIRSGVDITSIPEKCEANRKGYEKHLGWISRPEIPDMLAAADLFVQPGHPGPFNDYRIPCKLPEMLAMGRPVILPRTNLGKVIQHRNEAWVLDAADPASIAEAALAIQSEDSLGQRLAEGAFAFSRKSWPAPEAFYNPILDLYASLAVSPNNKPSYSTPSIIYS